MSEPILMLVMMTEKFAPIVRETRLRTETKRMAMVAVI
jgi:hypothetical protein